MKVTLEDVKKNKAVQTYIRMADESLRAMGYTEHGFAHVERVAETAREILLTLGYSEREAELASIAGYLHDIGNVVNREGHAQSGAVMAFRILDDMGADPEDTAVIITAIGNHDEGTGTAVSDISAAIILADKSDAHRSRVSKTNMSLFDKHDRVNYAVTDAKLRINKEEKKIILDLTIDTNMCPVLDYFEIFMDRTMMSKHAAKYLGLWFEVVINDTNLL